jgi:hypothetical protein
MYIKVLNESSLNKLQNKMKRGKWVVNYYADYCGHCQSMKPEWNKFIIKIKKNPSVNVADIESQFLPKLKSDPQVMGFPTIKMYNDNKPIAEHDGERTCHGFEKFVADNLSHKNKKTNDNLKSQINELKPTNVPSNLIQMLKGAIELKHKIMNKQDNLSNKKILNSNKKIAIKSKKKSTINKKNDLNTKSVKKNTKSVKKNTKSVKKNTKSVKKNTKSVKKNNNNKSNKLKNMSKKRVVKKTIQSQQNIIDQLKQSISNIRKHTSKDHKLLNKL